VTSLARTGNPTTSGVPVWHQFKVGGDDEGGGLGLVMSLNAGADSQATLRAQIRFAHQCAFWDSVAPGPGGGAGND